MKKIFYLSILTLAFSSCVQLPNLLPNGDNSDMVIVEVNQEFPGFTETLIVDENLTLFFDDGDASFSGCGTYALRAVDGQILTTDNVDAEGKYLGLKSGELVGGFVEGSWKDRYRVANIWDLFTTCATLYNISSDVPVLFGMRFKIAGKWHYGWIEVYVGESDFDPYIGAVGYNINPGTNVRIGS